MDEVTRMITDRESRMPGIATLGIAIFMAFPGVLMPMAYAGTMEFFFQRQKEEALPFAAVQSVVDGRFEQLIDHQNPAVGTFSQRYYLDESYARTADAPVFFYICGEAACEKRSLNGAIRDFARKYHARLVALEHRYYGKSLPYDDLSTWHLRYLSTTQALQDLAYFQQTITAKHHWKGKWVAFGGSYPGSLSAYYRAGYPELVVGSLASSAPVMAKADFIEYDAHVTRVAGVECANSMREAIADMEQALSDAPRMAAIKALFEASGVHDDIDFLYVVADIGAGAVQYGLRDRFCTALSDNRQTVLENYAAFARYIYRLFHTSALELSAQGAMSENPADYQSGIGARSWMYQSCTEYGYWQNAHPDPAQSTRSALINAAYHQNLCNRLFGIQQPADTNLMNQTYYFPLMEESVSRIYLTNGSDDPWSMLSMTSENGNAVNRNLSYAIIDGAAHCEDLRGSSQADSQSLRDARQRMDVLLATWLKQVAKIP
ncbi:S28 family serine protease [Legionella spiritensis]|nr:S28 family serine protease [Legionella spiritensis]